MNNSYTISLEDIIDDIYKADNENQTGALDMMLDLKSAKALMEKKINYALPTIFNFDFKCYGDEQDKLSLEKAIIKKYYTREICCDSVLRWQLFLEERLNDIMDKYINMYNAQAKLIAELNNLFTPYNITETKERDITDVNTSTSTNNATSTTDNEASSTSKTDNTMNTDTTAKASSGQKYSDTPQSEIDYDTNYLTNYTGNESNSSASEISTNNTTDTNTAKSNINERSNATLKEDSNSVRNDDYVKTIKGNLGKINYAELTKAYIDVIMNIEKSITDELADLFYLVY